MSYSVFYRRSSAIDAPTGFALEKLRDAKRVYEKTTSGRALNASQELHHAARAGAPQSLKDEHRFLLTRERPAVTEVVAWAASNGDRSENADYQYGKRRLRQIDGRIRFLTKRIEAAEVVDPEAPRAGQAATRAFFGATVRYANAAGAERVG
jgi:transcription elongation factor GreB